MGMGGWAWEGGTKEGLACRAGGGRGVASL